MLEKIINKLDSYYIGVGGFGDLLVSMTTFYDDESNINLIWFADNKSLIDEAVNLFSKFKNKLIFSKSSEFFQHWNSLVNNQKCKGTGIAPKDLNYNEWAKVDIFKKYNVNPNPKFVEEIQTNNSEKHVCVMLKSNVVPGKNKALTFKSLEKLYETLRNKKVYIVGREFSAKDQNWIDSTKLTLLEQMQLIKGAQEVYSVDSWVQNWSALCGIKTYCYNNIYSKEYLNSMGGDDWGHNVFIYPWENKTLIQQ